MPIYLYEHPKTGEVREVIQLMNSDHSYSEVKNGKQVEWKRVFTSPRAAIDTRIDEFSSTEYVEKTRNKQGTVGDLFDQSKELSQKREQRAGRDKIKQKYYDDYAKKRGGRRSLEEKRDNRKTDFDGFSINFDSN